MKVVVKFRGNFDRIDGQDARVTLEDCKTKELSGAVMSFEDIEKHGLSLENDFWLTVYDNNKTIFKNIPRKRLTEKQASIANR